MNDNKMITQSRIIEEYGWTKSLISKFLPDPVLKANPHYRKAAPMRLWDEDTVKQVMTTSEFQDAMEKANKRKKSASKAVETKYSNMNHSVQLFIDSITIKVCYILVLYGRIGNRHFNIQRRCIVCSIG